jgi:hypothetical protein
LTISFTGVLFCQFVGQVVLYVKISQHQSWKISGFLAYVLPRYDLKIIADRMAMALNFAPFDLKMFAAI